MKNKWYWTFKYILIGPFLRVWNRPRIEGLENIPDTGSAILASSHQAVMDSFYFPLLCPRQITFPAKSEYFTTKGVVGGIQRWFFTTVGQVPVDRHAADAGDAMLHTAEQVFACGDLFGIYPEGTRSPDGRIYRGRTGMARIALRTGQTVVPVAMIGSRDANPIGSWFPRPRKVQVRVGKPIDPLAWAAGRGLDPQDRGTARALTDFVMKDLARLAGVDYVNVYASIVKDSLAAGHGYPPGAELRG